MMKKKKTSKHPNNTQEQTDNSCSFWRFFRPILVVRLYILEEQRSCCCSHFTLPLSLQQKILHFWLGNHKTATFLAQQWRNYLIVGAEATKLPHFEHGDKTKTAAHEPSLAITMMTGFTVIFTETHGTRRQFRTTSHSYAHAGFPSVHCLSVPCPD